MKEIILIGSGGHCRSVIDVIEQEGKFKIAGLIDKSDSIAEEIIGYPLIGNDQDLEHLTHKYKYAHIAVGQIKSSSLRKNLFTRAKELGFLLPTIISPRAYIAKNTNIDEGSVVMHDAIVNVNVRIGKNCIINSRALVEHDSVIQDHCHISTNATINGGVEIGEGSFLGSGSVTKENIKVDAYSFVKAGSVVK